MPSTSSLSTYDGLYPLEEFYAKREGAARIVQHWDASSLDAEAKAYVGQSVLLWSAIEAADVPEPFRSLLVHRSDMTSTLEKFYKDKIHIDARSSYTIGQAYFREVVLRLDQSDRRVEFGAIKVMLDILPFEARQEILRERQPFGRILTESGVEFSSRPRAYLRIISDDFINSSLDLNGPQILYGRLNTLSDPWDRALAEIVEILPPA